MFQLLLKSSVFSLTSALPTAFPVGCVRLRCARAPPEAGGPPQNDSSADAAVTVLFPAVMICVLRDLIADPPWFVITSCYWLPPPHALSGLRVCVIFLTATFCQRTVVNQLSELSVHVPGRGSVQTRAVWLFILMHLFIHLVCEHPGELHVNVTTAL